MLTEPRFSAPSRNIRRAASGDRRLVGVPEPVQGSLVERASDELHADRQSGGCRAARDGEAREAGQVRRARKPGYRRADGLLVPTDVYFPLIYERRRDRHRRGEEDVHLAERLAKLVFRFELLLLGARVAVSLETLAVREARDPDYPHHRAQGTEDLDGFPYPLPRLVLDVLEVEILRDADHAAPDAVVQVAGEVLGRSVRGVRVFRIVAREHVQEKRVVLDGVGERSDVVEGPGEGEDAVFAYAPERRLHADDAAEGGGDAHGAAGVGA